MSVCLLYEYVANRITLHYWNVRKIYIYEKNIRAFLITLVNTQNVSATKIFYSSLIQFSESKYGLSIHFFSQVVMIHEVWLNA